MDNIFLNAFNSNQVLPSRPTLRTSGNCRKATKSFSETMQVFLEIFCEKGFVRLII